MTFEEKKTRIIKAASRVFARKGFAGTLISEVAGEAGIGKGTVYEYFKSKEDLFFAVFEWLSNQSNEAVKIDIAALRGTAAERLVVMNDSVMKAWMNEMDNFALVMEFWAASASSTIRNRFKDAFKVTYEQFRYVVGGLIRDGIAGGEFRPDVDPDAVAASLVGTWDALLLQRWFESIEDPLAYSREFLKIVLSGLSKKVEIN